MRLFLLLLLARPVGAQSVRIAPGPARRPLFVQLYRQSVYAAVRYGRGLIVYDGDLSPGATAALTVEFLDEGADLRIRLRDADRSLASGAVPFPNGEWAILDDIENARRFAEVIAAKISKGAPVPTPARVGTDMARAQIAFETFDFPSMVWLINVLGEAQKGSLGAADALKLMSTAYAWSGHWLHLLPSAQAKLFEARALAYASLAGALSGNASSELASALVQSGRPGDALFLLARSTPDAAELSSIADALARQDVPKARARSKESRQWQWTLAFAGGDRGLAEEQKSALRNLRSDPGDFPALHILALNPEVSEGHGVTGALLSLPFRLWKSGDFLAGRRLKLEDSDSAGVKIDFTSLVEGVRKTDPGDPSEEIPRGTRAGLLLDAALDATILRMEFIVHFLAMPEDGAALAAAARPLWTAHPWGFVVPLIHEESERQPGDMDAAWLGFSHAPMWFGGVYLMEREFYRSNSFSPGAWAASRDAEFDDVFLDDYARLGEPTLPFSGHHFAAIVPFSSVPYETEDEALVDQGLAKLGDRPDLLRLKLRRTEARRPRDLAKIFGLTDRLITLEPANWEVLWTRASLLVMMGKPLAAAESWRDLVRRKPKTLEAAHAVDQMAWDYSVAGRFGRARQLAVAAAPAYSHTALLTMAHAFEDTGRFDLAERVYFAIGLRYPSALQSQALGMFYMRTGDPRGYGLVHAGIPRFFAHQNERGVVLTDKDHLDLLDSFLMSEEWPNAFQLLNTVIVPRWHENDARYLLWLGVAEIKSGQGGLSDVEALFERKRREIHPQDSLLPIIDAFALRKTVEDAVGDLTLEPRIRSTGLYMLAQFSILSRADSAKTAALLESVVALRQFEVPEYYLALKALDRVPSYPQRLLRQFKGIWEDIARAPGRINRAIKEYGRKR